MEKFPTWVPVVALALVNSKGTVLLQERPAGKHHAGLWEFPGGKVEQAESPRDSLVREIEEELGLTLDPMQFSPAGFSEEMGDSPVVLFLYSSHEQVSPPRALEGQRFGWFTLEEARALPLAPMDTALLEQLARQKAE